MTKDLLGSHVGLSGPLFYEGSVQKAISFGETCWMFYTGAPQNTRRAPLDSLKIPEGIALAKQNGLDPKMAVVHAPYIVNLSSEEDPDKFSHGVSFIAEDLRRAEAFSSHVLVVHPGSHLGRGREYGLNCLIHALDQILEQDGTSVRIALETMAGKGGEVGTRLEDYAYVLSKVRRPERIGICLDTCHMNDAGYDVKDVDALLDEFNAILGLGRLLVVHLNDSKNERGSHKDRHENIGYGTIGFAALERYVKSPRIAAVPKILETPEYEKKSTYKKEIEMLRSGLYEEGWRESL